ncbi:MAG: FAD binding domain-containing protein [Acidimicrobiales bacterium]|jgi:carbon-monoxide dehydrogenase medium subunit
MSEPEVLVAGSPAEAVGFFGDGHDVTVIGGGTVVTPLLTHGGLWPKLVLMLHGAGLGGIVDGDPLEIGAAATLAAVARVAPEPLASAARIPDYEIRGQATVGGNLMIGGDLQAALVALGARVRTAGAGGERVDPVEDFIVAPWGRLVLSIEVRRPLAGAFVQQRRRHSHTHPVLTVAVARRADGVHVAVGALAERAPAVACPSVERALAGGAAPREAAAQVLDDVRPEDDPLASAWYRRRVLPVLVARALEQLEQAEAGERPDRPEVAK